MDEEKFIKLIGDTLSRGKKPPGEKMIKYQYKDVEPYLTKLAAEIGIDLKDVLHVITDEFINKQEKHHGNDKSEIERGNAPYSSKDLEKIPDMLDSPDIAVAGIQRGGEYPNHFAYGKGNSIFIERHFPTQKELRSTALYNLNDPDNTITKEKAYGILGANIRSDLSNAVFADKDDIKRLGSEAPEAIRNRLTDEQPPAVATSAKTSDQPSGLNLPYKYPAVKNEVDKKLHRLHSMSRV